MQQSAHYTVINKEGLKSRTGTFLCHKSSPHAVLTRIQSPVKRHGGIQVRGKMAPVNLSRGAAPVMGVERAVAYYRVHPRYWRLRRYTFPLGRGQCRFSFMIGRLARRDGDWKNKTKKKPTPWLLKKTCEVGIYSWPLNNAESEAPTPLPKSTIHA